MVRFLWQQHSQEEDWGFLLIDAQNAFNKDNRTAILWVVRHQWTSGIRFTLNFYFHWATLVIRAGDGMGHFLFSKEGVTQRYPLAILEYGLGILPLIQELLKAHPDFTQPWYADESELGGIFEGIWRHLYNLMVIGSPHG